MTQSDFRDIFTRPSRWRIIDEPLSQEAEAALQHDSHLLKEVASGKRGATARIWEVPQTLVVTRKETRFPAFQTACDQMAEDGWPVIVRDSGGTSVPLHPGILNLSLIFPVSNEDKVDLDSVYQALCEPIKLAVNEMGLSAEYGETPGSYCDGRYNLNIDGLKITGTAQKLMMSPPNARGVKQGVLAQAMLMVEADAAEGTDWVNRFYQLAGNKRQFDPGVATSLAAILPEQADLTLQMRDLLVSKLKLLANTA